LVFPIAVEKVAVGKAGRSRKSKTESVMIRPREKEERRRQTVTFHVMSVGEGFPPSSSACLSDLSGHKAVVQGDPSRKKA
jgi:hypothetical protein